MGWYGREKLTKYYSVGFTEKELQQINTAYERQKNSVLKAFFKRRTNLIRHLVLTYFELERENNRLKNILAARSAAERESKQDNQAINESPETLTWTGYYRGVKREGNTIYPEWG